MKASLLALVPVLAFAQDPAAPAAEKLAAEKKPAALAAVERTAALHDRFGASFVEVAWKLKRDEEGRSPARSMPYCCPNCGGIHYRNLDSLISENRSFAVPGFALAADRFLSYDPRFRTSGVERVEIRLPAEPGKAWPARAVASYPEKGALLFETDEPLPGVEPLAFAAAGAMPDEPSFFFVVREDGMLTTGVRSKSANDFTRFPALGRDYVKGVENALLVNASNEAVTVSFRDRFEVGKDGFEAPSAWTAAPPDASEKAAAALEARLARAYLPVFLRLDPKAQEERQGGRRGMFSSYDDDDDEDGGGGDEKDLVGAVFAGGRVMIPTGAGASEIARLDKIEATLPDGTKVPLEFQGALKDYAIVVAAFGNGVPAGVEPLEPAEGPIEARYLQPAFSADVEKRGDAIRIRVGHDVLDSFDVGRDDRIRAAAEDDLFDADGRIIQWAADRRRGGSRWSADHDWLNGALLADFAAGKLPFDPEIVPRKGKDRVRVAWFGADLQPVTKEVAREKKALAWLGTKRDREVDTRGALVSHVYPGSAAEKIGVKEGDILLFARSDDGSVRRAIEKTDGYGESIDWEEIYEQAPVQLFERIPVTPWPAVGEGADAVLTSFGIGNRIGVEWLSDGAFKQAEFDVEVAPPSYRTATRARSKALGVIVADATFEVREYYKLADDETGVVVTKCKNGSPAAVAGLRPFELVTKVDDKPVADARAFLDATKGRETVTLAVRRLTSTRVVRVSLRPEDNVPAADPDAPAFDDAGDGADE
ncbi:MAG: PDZ domain-containing protein [Kiritimatiellae bacterium]|nr:PDZ domain-containing protein [Kiritimatiellia bacterium]